MKKKGKGQRVVGIKALDEKEGERAEGCWHQGFGSSLSIFLFFFKNFSIHHG